MIEITNIAPDAIASPKKQGEALLNFYDALKKAVSGYKISRIEWQDVGWYGFLDKEILKIHKPDGSIHNWIVSLGDILGEDWVLL